MGDCRHDYQLETVGGVYLTGAYVCRLCSVRVGMSDEQFHRHVNYPRHYQVDDGNEGTVEARAHRARERYARRLADQMKELTSEKLPSTLSEEERNEILTEVIEEALLEVVEACKDVARYSGLPDGQAIAGLIERNLGGKKTETPSSPFERTS